MANGIHNTADFIGYYAISNSPDLYWFAKEVYNGSTSINAVLTADIVVNENVLTAEGELNGTPSYSWTPIGTSSQKYAGTFDGNGHTISGLYFNNTTNRDYPNGGKYAGLIGYAYGATIKNVGVIGSYIRGDQYVSGICGYGSNSSGTNTTITNCNNTGMVTGSAEYVGGICGSGGVQTNCHNTGMVSGFKYVGGICGQYGTQTKCYNTGTITSSSSSSSSVGGICGSYGTQTNCYNTGTVSGFSGVGGICGSGGTQTNCYNTGTVSGSNNSDYVGGICGYNGTQTNCYNTGAVTGTSKVGGICGNNGTQTNCYYLAGSSSSSGGGVFATAEEFASGKIGYLLNGNNNNAWYQDLYYDGYPLLDNTHNLASGHIEEVGDKYTVVVCFMGVMDEDDVCMGEMRARYPNAEFKRQTMPEHQNVRHFLMKDWKHVGKIRIYVRGTDFQIAVWQELLKIPVGKVSTYGEIARNIGRPRSLRPVGNAVGNNPVIYLIPCHRVICSSGKMGRFHWGVDLKLLLLNFESRSGRKIQGFFNWEPTLF